jgi:ATP-dependent DNA helicase RecQ
MVRAYAEARTCRRERLLSYFGDAYRGPCGNCDRCDGETPDQGDADHAPFAVGDDVVHVSWGEGRIVQIDRSGQLTVMFDEVGYKQLLLPLVLERGLLTTDDV